MTAQNPLAKVAKFPESRSSAINAKCYECLGGTKEDLRTQNSVVNMIRGCSSSDCPLWHLRPYTSSPEGSNK